MVYQSRKGESYTAFTARLDPSRYELLRVASVVTNTSMSLILDQALDEWLQTHSHELRLKASATTSQYQDAIDILAGKPPRKERK